MDLNTINKICNDLYDGSNYSGNWHGCDFWGKAADFHEHAKPIWNLIQTIFLQNNLNPINIVETGRCTGQSTILFSAIADYVNR